MKIEAKARLTAALTEKQKQLDINGDGKITSDDLKRLRNGEKPVKAGELLASGAEWVSAGIRDRLVADKVAVSKSIKMGMAVTFAYDWDSFAYDDLEGAVKLLSGEEKVSRLQSVIKGEIEVVSFTIDSCVVTANLSCATVTVIPL